MFQAFNDAWEVACSSGGAVLLVPENNYLLKPFRFSGPCRSNIEVQVIVWNKLNLLVQIFLKIEL